MTRKEQINLYLKERNIPITSLEANSIIEGVEWADEHPNSNGKELLYVAQKTTDRTKKEIIGKACKWLENELYEVMAEPNPYYIYEVQSKSYNSLEILFCIFNNIKICISITKTIKNIGITIDASTTILPLLEVRKDTLSLYECVLLVFCIGRKPLRGLYILIIQ
jgi:hypothetical protein